MKLADWSNDVSALLAPLLKKRVMCGMVVDAVWRVLFSGTLVLLHWGDGVLFGRMLGFAWFVGVGGIYLAPQMVILSQSQRL